MCNNSVESLKAEIATLQARVNTLEQEKLVAQSNVADLLETLQSIGKQATKAIKS